MKFAHLSALEQVDARELDLVKTQSAELTQRSELLTERQCTLAALKRSLVSQQNALQLKQQKAAALQQAHDAEWSKLDEQEADLDEKTQLEQLAINEIRKDIANLESHASLREQLEKSMISVAESKEEDYAGQFLQDSWLSTKRALRKHLSTSEKLN